jgi:hypothetical protein
MTLKKLLRFGFLKNPSQIQENKNDVFVHSQTNLKLVTKLLNADIRLNDTYEITVPVCITQKCPFFHKPCISGSANAEYASSSVKDSDPNHDAYKSVFFILTLNYKNGFRYHIAKQI